MDEANYECNGEGQEKQGARHAVAWNLAAGFLFKTRFDEVGRRPVKTGLSCQRRYKGADIEKGGKDPEVDPEVEEYGNKGRQEETDLEELDPPKDALKGQRLEPEVFRQPVDEFE